MKAQLCLCKFTYLWSSPSQIEHTGSIIHGGNIFGRKEYSVQYNRAGDGDLLTRGVHFGHKYFPADGPVDVASNAVDQFEHVLMIPIVGIEMLVTPFLSCDRAAYIRHSGDNSVYNFTKIGSF